jgi:ABC-type thiamin/hydroxymethylpyrimidine transport system permease subunit
MSSSISTRDIVTIAILASLGGALSTFVGYLGNLINLSLGVPFGAGQFMAGLHVFWLVLIRVIVPKRGVGTAGGLLKGMIEMFTGSTHGIVIVVVSLIQGFVVDISASAAGSTENPADSSRITWWLGAGVSSAVNVIVLQLFYFTGAPFLYIFVISILALCSGIIFAGYFAWETLEFLNDAGTISGFQSIKPVIENSTPKSVAYRNLPAIAFVLFLTVGSLYYTTNIANVFADPYSCEVRGLVDNPFSFTLEDFPGSEVTIEAELIGAYTHIPPANYTGLLISTILQQASVQSGAVGLQIIARDGYSISLDIADVMIDSELLLSRSDNGLWLIAENYDGSMWVRQVILLQVY